MKRKGLTTRLLILLCSLFFLTLIALIVFIQYSFIVVSGTSMQPLLAPKDLIVVRQTHTDTVDYGDVVVAFSEDERKLLIKRVIGKSGDRIQIKADGVYRNGEKLKEDYLNEKDYQYEDNVDVTVEDDTYYLLGDNRRVSVDSRSEKVGKIYTHNILGVYEFNVTALTGKNADEFPRWALNIGLTVVGLLIIIRFVLWIDRRRNKSDNGEGTVDLKDVEAVNDLSTGVTNALQENQEQEEGSVIDD